MKNRPPGYSRQHADTPALVMGNGPSLSELDFHDLGEFATFGMNAAYRFWSKVGWWPQYYACLDSVVGLSHLDQIRAMIEEAPSLGISHFLLRHNLIRGLGRTGRSERVVCYESLLAEGWLPKLRDVTTGSHTMLWAESLGYSTILLGGVDCRYVELVEGAAPRDSHLEIVRKAENPNYFFADYQQPGDRFNVPNATPDMHVNSWINASRCLAPQTAVVNLNPDSNVRCFPLNLNPETPTRPGRMLPPSVQTSDERRATEISALKSAIAHCNRYTAKPDLPGPGTLAERILLVSHKPVVNQWRRHLSVGVEISSSKLPESRPSVWFGGVGRVAAVAARNPAGPLAPTNVYLVSRHDGALPQLIRLIRSLHEDHATPPLLTRLMRALSRSVSLISFLLPHRVRAIDYRSKFHTGRRLN